MRKAKPIPPEYLFWRNRIEGQIRHTMNEHPEFFTEAAYEDNMVGRMAKRIIGEIVAGTLTGDNQRSRITCDATALNGDSARYGAESEVVCGIITAGHPLLEEQKP